MKEGDKYQIGFIVDTDVYRGFINCFHDNNPLHTDADFAKLKGFKGVVMHGNILNGFLSYFIGEKLPMKNVMIHHQDIQFAKPIYLNDRLTFFAVITGFYEPVNTYDFKFYFQNEEGKKVAKGNIQILVLA